VTSGERFFVFGANGRSVGLWLGALGWTGGAAVGGWQRPGEPLALEELPPLPPLTPIGSLPTLGMPEGL